MERWDRLYPAPKEWSTFLTKLFYQKARNAEDDGKYGSQASNWARIGSSFREARKRLEDLNGDGKGLVPQNDSAREGVPLSDVGEVGFDVTSMSEEWIRGYHYVLLHAGLAAERLQDQVNDTTRAIVFPKEMMVGPSNPFPRPVPPGLPHAPREEDCVPASIPPEHLYVKILTTKGFNTRQRLDAALAYGSWLDYSERPAEARQLYDYAVEIASSALPDASQIVDKNAVLKPGTGQVSQNLVDATTALALHHARTNNLNSALPILLSVLRARREAPFVQSPKAIPQSNSPLDVAKDFITGLFTPGKFPPPPPSGNEPFVTRSGDACEEAAVMAYIGEILFALNSAKSSKVSSESEQGISFSKEAFTVATKQARDTHLELDKRERCVQCADLAVKNLLAMVQRLAKQERESAVSAPKASSGWSFWANPGSANQQGEEGRWALEQKEVENMMDEVRREGMKEMLWVSRRSSDWLGDVIKWWGSAI